jgi:hypothetical protein
MTSTPDSNPVVDGPRGSFARLAEYLGWMALATLLIVEVPLFLRMPAWVDIDFYDVCTRYMLCDGSLEREFVFLPPRGMPWTLALIRSLLGWSSEAVRLGDLIIVSTIVYLLVRLLKAAGVSRVVQVWTVVALAGFYLTRGESNHCQPDVWMLLPPLVALHLRRRQLEALARGSLAVRSGMVLSVLEGIFWAAGCLFKPFVAVPALVTWLVAVRLSWGMGSGWGQRLLRDAASVLVGGLLVGALWQGALLASGNWSRYWEQIHEFRDYYALADDFPTRFWRLLAPERLWESLLVGCLLAALGILLLLMLPRRKQPRTIFMVLLVSLGVIPCLLVVGRLTTFTLAFSMLAGLCVLLSLLRPVRGKVPHSASLVAMPLLASLFLGWLIQATFIQFRLEYHLIPVVLLAISLLAGSLTLPEYRPWGWAGLLLFGVFGVLNDPPITADEFAGWRDRVSQWSRCWTDVAGTGSLHDDLAVSYVSPTLTELDRVIEFLRSRGVRDREVACWNSTTVVLYLRLQVRPPSRFLLPDVHMSIYPHKRKLIVEELKAARPRYILLDMIAMGVPPEQARTVHPDGPFAYPPVFSKELIEEYPLSEPVVFRAGRYYVVEPRRISPERQKGER